jgi:2-iminobutanoate/2-iminopropanoate deaminase
MPKQVVESPDVFPLRKFKALDPPHGIPISMAVKARGAFMWAKQVPVNKQGESVAPGDMKTQTEQVLKNLAATVKAAGARMTDVAAITWYTTKIDAFYDSAASQLRTQYLPEPYPTSVVVEISRLARREWMVECMAIVNVPE